MIGTDSDARLGSDAIGAGFTLHGPLRRRHHQRRVDARARLRRRMPGAHELVYDNYNALVIGFGPTERASDAVFSLALYPRWVTLFFLFGATLPDPLGLLKGSGKQVRSIRLETASIVDTPGVGALLDAALAERIRRCRHTAAAGRSSSPCRPGSARGGRRRADDPTGEPSSQQRL